MCCAKAGQRLRSAYPLFLSLSLSLSLSPLAFLTFHTVPSVLVELFLYLQMKSSPHFLKLPGKDITHKLYSVSEGLMGAGGGNDRDAAGSNLTRSASVDAVHEGSRGRLRSDDWRARSTNSKGKSKGIENKNL